MFSGNEARLINQDELVAKLDTFFEIASFDESRSRKYLPAGYESILARFATPNFLSGSWNGLMLANAEEIDRVYPIVFPGQSVLDEIIAREVERGAPGAMIFSHHLHDYQESGPGFSYMADAQLEELKAHSISFYNCHAPLDCNREISTSLALADALKLRDQERFAPYIGGLAGVYGKSGAIAFDDFVRKVSEATALPHIRYDQVRNNGRPVQQVAIVTGAGAEGNFVHEAIGLGCDTFVTGEWWFWGPGDWRAAHREDARILLTEANINLIGTSHFASEAVVMRDIIPDWLYAFAPGAEPIFIGQDDPWR